LAKIKKGEEARVAHLLTELESCKKIAQGHASFEGWGFSSVRVLISRLITLDEKIPEIDKNRIVSSAIFEAAGNGKLNKISFAATLSQKENEYLKKPYKQFRMVGQVSLAPSLCPQHLKIIGSRITFGLSKQEKLYRNHYKITAHVNRLQVPPQPQNYTPFSVSCIARTSTHAFETAGRAFELWRGCLNLGINRGITWRVSFDRRAPVNSLLAHPVYTIHHATGNLVNGSWYYDSTYQTEHKLLSDSIVADNGKKCFEIIRRKLNRHPYGAAIINAITRYVRALDNTAYETAFMQLWSICEALTLTTTSDGKRTVRLVKSIYKEEMYVEVVLQVLREFRNRAVHFGEQTQDMEDLLFQIKTFVEDLIFFHAFNRYKLASLEEAVTFLDLGSNLENLATKQSVLRKAIRRASSQSE